MQPAPTEVTNMPLAPLWIIALAQGALALAMLIVAFALVSLFASLRKVLENIESATKQLDQDMPNLLESWRRREGEAPPIPGIKDSPPGA